MRQLTPLLWVTAALLSLPALAPAAVTVTGTVLLPDGSPAGGAQVYLEADRGDDATYTAGTADAAGHFSITDKEKHPALWLAVTARRPGSVPAWARADEHTPLTLRLGAHPVTYTGRVCDPAGKPIPGADARLESLDNPGNWDFSRFYFGEDTPLRAVSGPDGRFHISDLPPGGEATFRVTAPGRAALWRKAWVSGASAPFLLEPEATASGKITRQGQYTPGMKLWAFGVCAGTGRIWYTGTVAAAPDGSFRLEHLPAGSGFLLAYDPADDPPVSAAFVLLTTQAGQAVTGLTLDLVPGASLSGHVRAAETGDPVPDVCVFLDWRAPSGPAESWGSAWTDQDGSYHTSASPGHLELRVYGPGRDRWDSNLPADASSSDSLSFDVTAGEVCRDQNFVITLPGRLTGRVLRPDGAPAAGAILESEAADGRLSSAQARALATTDADGRFAIPWDPPQSDSDYHPGWQVAARLPAEGLVGSALVKDAKHPVELRLAPGAFLTCSVRDQRGAPLRGVTVSVAPDPAKNAHGVPFMVASDAAGRLTAGPLPPGDYRLDLADWTRRGLAGAPWILAEGVEVTLAAGQHLELPELRFHPGRTASGTVVDPQGHPVSGALIYAGPGLPRAVATDRRGHFEMRGLPREQPGRMDYVQAKLVALDPLRGLLAVASLTDQPTRLRLQLQAPGTVTGQAVNEAGQPLPKMRVGVYFPFPGSYGGEASFLADQAGFQGSALETDADGKFTVPGALLVPPGLLWLGDPNYGHQQYAETQVELNAPGAATVDVGRVVMKPAPPAPVPPSMKPAPPPQ